MQTRTAETVEGVVDLNLTGDYFYILLEEKSIAIKSSRDTWLQLKGRVNFVHF